MHQRKNNNHAVVEQIKRILPVYMHKETKTFHVLEIIKQQQTENKNHQHKPLIHNEKNDAHFLAPIFAMSFLET